MEGKLEILLVDDDEMTLFIHEKIMQRCELKTPYRSFHSAQLCLDYLSRNDADSKLFLILLDINMPGMSGWEMLQHLESDLSHIKTLVIMATSSVDFEDRKRAEKFDCVVDFIEKPFSINICKELMSIPQVAALNG